MYGNLRDDQNSNLKGEVGEIIAKHHLKSCISTRNFDVNRLHRFALESEQINFLKENWYSFDLIDPQSKIIYEVKTRKYFHKKLVGIKNKIVITPNFNKISEQAQQLGFSVKLLEITLFSDWNYGIIIKDFNPQYFWVHLPRPSGWERAKRLKTD